MLRRKRSQTNHKMTNLVKEGTATDAFALRPGNGIGEMREVLTDPLFVLAPPRSFTSVVGTMLGQHPQMYALPETHLLSCQTMAEWWRTCEEQSFPRGHGLLRAVAELFFGGQTDRTVRLASGWLRRRSHFTTGLLMEALAARVHPRIIVDKSPSVVYSVKFLESIHSLFPKAKFIHLLRHPRAHGESVLRFLEERRKRGPVPASHWLLYLATYPDLSDSSQATERSRELDPQKGWFVLNQNINEFFKSLSNAQKLRVRGEDLLQSPDEPLRQIAEWMGLAADETSIEAMKHPERSCYACFGPPSARYGNDDFFLQSPALRPARAQPQCLEGPLSWRNDEQGFLPEVESLAREFGYE
jgi:sulfotransferase family protein